MAIPLRDLDQAIQSAEKLLTDLYRIRGLSAVDPELMTKPVEILVLSGRARGRLAQNGVITVGDLVKKTRQEILLWRGTGSGITGEIEGALIEHGLHLA